MRLNAVDTGFVIKRGAPATAFSTHPIHLRRAEAVIYSASFSHVISLRTNGHNMASAGSQLVALIISQLRRVETVSPFSVSPFRRPRHAVSRQSTEFLS